MITYRIAPGSNDELWTHLGEERGGGAEELAELLEDLGPVERHVGSY